MLESSCTKIDVCYKVQFVIAHGCVVSNLRAVSLPGLKVIWDRSFSNGNIHVRALYKSEKPNNSAHS